MPPPSRSRRSPSTVTIGATACAPRPAGRCTCRRRGEHEHGGNDRDQDESGSGEPARRRTSAHEARIVRAGKSRLEQAASEAAVDRDDGARDVRGAVGGQEADHVADLPGAADAPQRDLRDRLRRSETLRAAARVSMRPGAIELTVMPSAPTSRARDFAQPTTPGRTAFESARRPIGSRTVLDSMLIDPAAPTRRRWGRQRSVSRIAESSSKVDRRLEPLDRQLERRAARRAAAVVDEDVDAAERLQRLVDEPLQVARVASRRRGRRARRSARPPARARRAAARTSPRSRPRRASVSAIARPMPADAPQTIAVRPFRPRSTS